MTDQAQYLNNYSYLLNSAFRADGDVGICKARGGLLIQKATDLFLDREVKIFLDAIIENLIFLRSRWHLL